MTHHLRKKMESSFKTEKDTRNVFSLKGYFSKQLFKLMERASGLTTQTTGTEFNRLVFPRDAGVAGSMQVTVEASTLCSLFAGRWAFLHVNLAFTASQL